MIDDTPVPPPDAAKYVGGVWEKELPAAAVSTPTAGTVEFRSEFLRCRYGASPHADMTTYRWVGRSCLGLCLVAQSVCPSHLKSIARSLPLQTPAEKTLKQLYGWPYGSSKSIVPTVSFRVDRRRCFVPELPALLAAPVRLRPPSRDDSYVQQEKLVRTAAGRPKVDGYAMPVRSILQQQQHCRSIAPACGLCMAVYCLRWCML